MLNTNANDSDTAEGQAEFSQFVDADGNISLPDVNEVQTNWAFLGAWHLADGMHVVYTQPESLTAYREDGVFPDGTVLVKEVRGKESGPMTTGQADWEGDIIQWFVMVKDSESRFEGENDLWGDNWGWALFKPDDVSAQLATSYTQDCMGCHIPAADTDRVFVQGYPVLSAFEETN